MTSGTTHIVRKLWFARVLLTGVVLMGASSVRCLAQTATNHQELAGRWEGTLGAGAVKLRIVLTMEKKADGAYAGVLNSVDQGAVIPMDTVTFQGNAVHFEIKAIGGVYDGTLNQEGAEITGTWTQTGVPPQPLSFKRSSDTAASQTSAPPGPMPKPLTAPLDIAIPTTPTAFKADAKWHLAYELHVANFGAWDCVLTSIEAVTGDSSEKSLAKFAALDLEGMVMHPGQRVTEQSKIGAGSVAVVFLWVTVDRLEDVPATIRHRIGMKFGAYPEEITIETPPISVDRKPVVVISPPLRGEDWVAANGPSNTSGHRRALLPIDGRTYISQRFATDWVEVYSDGKTYQGDPKDNKNYRAYGAEIHAVADGVVTEVKDGIPQNTPGLASRAVPITLETIGGNHVLMEIGKGRYGFYAHIQPGSIRVKVGDHVKRGQVLGLVGNTGNSTEPHLHFDICDASSMLGCEGSPFAFASFEVEGQGRGWKPADSHEPPVKHTMEIPLEGEVVRFPSAP